MGGQAHVCNAAADAASSRGVVQSCLIGERVLCVGDQSKRPLGLHLCCSRPLKDDCMGSSDRVWAQGHRQRRRSTKLERPQL